jgi:hypothetical protein
MSSLFYNKCLSSKCKNAFILSENANNINTPDIVGINDLIKNNSYGFVILFVDTNKYGNIKGTVNANVTISLKNPFQKVFYEYHTYPLKQADYKMIPI